ncbi:hexosaminidase [Stackebrandtia albiflava]|uniref:beta-N-acetylhexosaminidase n=1 Tax=Stackebrandtia albiflava TaxID=406432 RepID=A0A562V1Z3_9ACTN|nr:beta-N-acetylhexosaminidase [Stackebrandtia albiflava]TWJ11898.1 hexosaminidase [Stackebrandtia albiflava]
MSPSLIPQPNSLTARDGEPFRLDGDTVIVASGDAAAAGWLLHDRLRAGTGLALPVLPAAGDAGSVVEFTLTGDRPDDGTTAAEAYRLDVSTGTVAVSAAHPAGLVQAVHTIRQLLPADTLRSGVVTAPPYLLDQVVVEDEPRFAWRGVMVDTARHFVPKEFLLRMVDLAALHHLNTLHLHLTDDQGWRLEIPGWPKLTEIGAWRTETVVGHALDARGYDGTPHGGYYTGDDMREVVAYAAAQGMTVVPEIDLPGHVRSVLAAYPELGNTGERKPVATTFGIFSEILAPTEEALGFCRDVLDTVTSIFPSKVIHIGGDEVPRTEWRESTAARERATELGLAGPDLLQSWFTARFAEHLAAQGRSIVGWDEIMDGGAPSDAVVMVWRDFAIAAKAAAKGHRVVVAPVQATYLNYYASDLPEEPLHIHEDQVITLEKVAGFEPVPEGVDDSLVLGVQAQLWSEYLQTPRAVEYAAFPRLAAIAEIGWSASETRRSHPLGDRITHHLTRLDALGVNYRPLEGPHPWQQGGTGSRVRIDPDSGHGATPDLPSM